MRDDVHAEGNCVHLIDREGGPVEAYGALGRNEASQMLWNAKGEALGGPFGRDCGDLGSSVDMARDDVPAKLIGRFQGAFEIYPGSLTPAGERGLAQGFRRGIDGECRAAIGERALIDDSEADTGAGDRGSRRY